MLNQITKVNDEEIDMYLPENLKEAKLKSNTKANKSIKKMLTYIIKWSYTIEAQDNGYCYIPDDNMQAAVGMDKSNIPCYAQSLVTLGYLESFQRGNKRIKGQPAQASRYKLVDELMPNIDKVQSDSSVLLENVQSDSSVLLSEKFSLIEEKKTDKVQSDSEKDCNIIKDNIIKDNLIKVEGKVNMEEYITKSEFNLLLNKVESLVEENKLLNKRLDKAALVIKGLITKSATKQPAPTKPIEVNDKFDTKVANGNKHYDTINACIETIKSTNVAYQTKLEATKELQNLVNSGELTDGQVAMCKKWIEPNQQQLSTNQQSESIDNLVETTIAQYKEVSKALTVGDYSFIDTNGQELLDNINELRQLKKENKLSTGCLSKINTLITINNSTIEEVNEYFNLKASNKLNGTTDQITKETVSEAKKTAKQEEFKVQIEVTNSINQITNNLITKMNEQNYKSVEAEFKIDYDAAINLITLYDPKKHCGIKQNGWARLKNELSVHNSNY